MCLCAESQVVWGRDCISGWLARSMCAACFCFVPRDYLVCSIAFVVYIHGWTIYISLRRRSHVCPHVSSVYMRVLSMFGFSLSLSPTSYASPPRLRYPTFPPAVHASAETVVHRGFRRSRGIKRFTRPVAPGDISPRRFPMTSLPWDARISTITFSSRQSIKIPLRRRTLNISVN